MTGSSSNNVDCLWRELEEGRGDDTLKLALADAYAEAGGAEAGRDVVVTGRDVSHVLRWAVKNKRWPRKTIFDTWHWTSGHTGETPKRVTPVLPPPLYQGVKRHGGENTCRAAVLGLAVAMTRLKTLLGAEWP